eukprot:m51a1_g1988 hypothetical protein (3641) ;mRNA; r:1170322-1185145
MVCHRSWEELGLAGRDPRARGAHRYWCSKRAGLVSDHPHFVLPRSTCPWVCDICHQTFPKEEFKSCKSFGWHKRKCKLAHSQQTPELTNDTSSAAPCPSAPAEPSSSAAPSHSPRAAPEAPPAVPAAAPAAPVAAPAVMESVVPSPVVGASAASCGGSASTSSAVTPSMGAVDPEPETTTLPSNAEDLHLDIRIVPEEELVRKETKEPATPPAAGQRPKWVCKHCGVDFHHLTKGKYVAHVRNCGLAKQRRTPVSPQLPAKPKVVANPSTSTHYYCEHCEMYYPAALFKNRVAFGWHKRRCQGKVPNTPPAPEGMNYSSDTEDEAEPADAQHDQKRSAEAAPTAAEASPPPRKQQRVSIARPEITAGRRTEDGNVEVRVAEDGKEPRWVPSSELYANPMLLVEFYESRPELFGSSGVSEQSVIGVEEVVRLRKRENCALEALATTKSNPEGEWINAELLSGKCKLCEYYMSHVDQPTEKQEPATPLSAAASPALAKASAALSTAHGPPPRTGPAPAQQPQQAASTSPAPVPQQQQAGAGAGTGPAVALRSSGRLHLSLLAAAASGSAGATAAAAAQGLSPVLARQAGSSALWADSAPLRALWRRVLEAQVPRDRAAAMGAFLEGVVLRCSVSDQSALPLQWGETSDVCREILSTLLGALARQQTALAALKYMTSREGLLSSWALDIFLTNASPAPVPLWRSPAASSASCSSVPPSPSTSGPAVQPPPLQAQLQQVMSQAQQLLYQSGALQQALLALQSPQGSGPCEPWSAMPSEPLQYAEAASALARVVEWMLSLPIQAIAATASAQVPMTNTLVRILFMDYSTSDSGLVMVQRQAARCLATMLATASQDVNVVLTLAQRGIVESVLLALRRSHLACTVRVELTQVLVHALRVTSHLTCALVDAFRAADGYSVVSSNMLYVEKYGSPTEKVDFVNAMCLLLFVAASPRAAEAIEEEAEKSDELKTDLLKIVHLVLTMLISSIKEERRKQHRTQQQPQTAQQAAANTVVVGPTSQTCEGLPSAQSVFAGLDPFSVLFMQFDMLSHTNKSRVLDMFDEAVVANCVSLTDVHAYCDLLVGKRASTAVYICRHMTRSLNKEYLTRDQLHDAGLLSILTSFLVPPQELPCARAFLDPEEVRLTRFKMLFALLYQHDLRTEALDIISTLAQSVQKLETRVVPSLIAFLQSSGGTSAEEPSILLMWTQVLGTLCEILKFSKDAANVFRTSSGFAWALSVIEGLSRHGDDFAGGRATAFQFLVALLSVLCAAVKACPENKDYLREDIGFSSFSSSLKKYDIVSWECKEALLIDIPDIVQIILTDLVDAMTSANNAQVPCAVVDSIVSLFEANPANTEILCKCGTPLHILEHFGPRIVDRLKNRDVIAMKLLDVVVRLCKHNITTAELRTILQLASSSDYPPVLTHALVSIADSPQSPPASIELSRRTGIAGLGGKWLVERQWPCRKWSVSMWFYIDSRGSYAPGSANTVVPLISFRSTNKQCAVAAWMSAGSTLVFQLHHQPASSSPSDAKAPALQGQAVFSEIKFDEGVWYHVVVCCEALASRWKYAGASRCSTALYVNGALRAQVAMSMPPSAVTAVSPHLGFEGVLPDDDPAIVPYPPDSSAITRIANAYCFDDVISSEEALLLYSLGPGYCGSLSADLGPHLIASIILSDMPRMSEMHHKLLLEPQKCSLSQLADKVIFVFVAHNCSVVEPEFKPASSSQPPIATQLAFSRAAAQLTSAIPMPGFPSSDNLLDLTKIVRTSRSLRDTIQDVGGIPICLFMMGIASSSEQQRASLRLLSTLLLHSPRNCKQMSDIDGYKVVAKILRKREWTIDTAVLDVCMSLAGVARSRAPGQSAGVLANADAVRHVLLDWRVWSRASSDVQLALFNGLYSLVTSHSEAAYNISRLRSVDAVVELLHVLQGEVARPVVQAVINLIRAIMDEKPSIGDYKHLVDFLVATHVPPSSFTYNFPWQSPGMRRRPNEAEDPLADTVGSALHASQSVDFEDLTTNSVGSKHTLLRIPRPEHDSSEHSSVSSDMSYDSTSTSPPPLESQRRTIDFYVTPAASPRSQRSNPACWMPPVDEDKDMTYKRALVLEMLLDMLGRATSALQCEFISVLPLEAVLSMLQHPSLSLRIPLLYLLDLYLQKPLSTSVVEQHTQSAQIDTQEEAGREQGPATVEQHYERLGGFSLVGTQLQYYSVSTDLFHALFRLLIGSTYPRFSKAEPHLTIHAVWEPKGVGTEELARPGALVAILMAASARAATYDEQHTVIKALHHLFVSSPAVARSLLDNNLINGLLGILVARASSRRDQRPAGLPPGEPSAQDDDIRELRKRLELEDLQLNERDEAEEDDESWLDEDAMSLLRTIALHGCGVLNGAQLVAEILLVTRSVGLSARAAHDVRCRVLYDVFSFFQDNPSFVRDATLVTNFENVVRVSYENLRWKSLEIKSPPADALLVSARREEELVLLLFRLLRSVLLTSAVEPRLSALTASLRPYVWRVLFYALDRLHASPDALQGVLESLLMPVAVAGGPAVVTAEYLLRADDTRNTCALLCKVSRQLSSADARVRAVSERVWDLAMRRCPSPESLTRPSTMSMLLLGGRRLSSAGSPFANRRPALTGSPAACATEAPRVPDAVREEASRWDEEQSAVSAGFQILQEKAMARRSKRLARLSALVREQRFNIAQTAAAMRWRAQSKPMFDRAQQQQDDDALVERRWRRFFRDLTHERAVFALTLHLPLRRLKLDSTQGAQRQRSRVAQRVCIANSQCLMPPFSSICASGPPLPGELLPTAPTSSPHVTRLLSEPHDEALELSVDELPLITSMTPSAEDSTAGGTEITVVGKMLSPATRVLIAGVCTEVVAVDSDTQMRVRSPAVGAYGTYEAIAVCNGLFRVGCASRYSYRETALLDRYNAIKHALGGSQDRSAAQKGDDGKPRLRRNEMIRLYEKCCRISPLCVRDGELLVGDQGAYFHPGVCEGASSFSWAHDELRELHRRRHLLKDVALELFFTNGKACLFAFADRAARERVYDKIKSMNPANLVDYEAELEFKGGIMSLSLTEKWRRGMMSNFEYLMHLNTLAGRTFNDLNQYPVFPFIVADWTSDVLDLSNPKTFRDLSKPMGAQDPVRLKKFIEKYEQLEEFGEVPYLYGTHYSNGATVAHFLLRLEPFSTFHVEFQSGRFDIADRLFFTLEGTWQLASSSPLGDVKELIPELFCLPEFLENCNMLDLGEKQDNMRVNNVALPRWAHGSAREFVLKHREALESEYVSMHLHEWIDLIFGCKQQDRDALNVFHPFTCEGGVDLDAIEDPMEKLAKITQLNSWGQTPRQIFKKPHPQRKLSCVQELYSSAVFRNLGGLTPSPLWTMGSAVTLLAVTPDNRAVPLGPGVAPLPGLSESITWSHWDKSLRMCSTDSGRVSCIREADDVVSSGAVSSTGRCFVAGLATGVVKVWKSSKRLPLIAGDPSSLFGHTAAVVAVAASDEFGIIVSASDDGTCVVWDTNRLSYVSTLRCGGPVVAVCISPSSGDIVTADHSAAGKKPVSTVRLWSVNGAAVAEAQCSSRVLCVAVTTGAAGTCENVVAAGHEDGSLSFWKASDLEHICTVPSPHNGPITAIAFSRDCTMMFTGDSRGATQGWNNKPVERVVVPMRPQGQ